MNSTTTTRPSPSGSGALLLYDPVEGRYYRTVEERSGDGDAFAAAMPDAAPVPSAREEGAARPGRDRTVVDTMIVSDIHLGSDVSRSDELVKVLKGFSFKRLILNGDVFDDLNFTRLSKADWRLLSHIRKLSNPRRGCEVIWVAGNHDGLAEPLSHLLGVRVYDEFAWEMGGLRYLALHGHQFDLFITRRARISTLASSAYLLLQKMDGQEQRVSRWVKRTSKSWTRISEKIASDAISYGAARSADFIFCGHTHIAMQSESAGVRYFNSGCWTDRPSQFITVDAVAGVAIHEHP